MTNQLTTRIIMNVDLTGGKENRLKELRQHLKNRLLFDFTGKRSTLRLEGTDMLYSVLIVNASLTVDAEAVSLEEIQEVMANMLPKAWEGSNSGLYFEISNDSAPEEILLSRVIGVDVYTGEFEEQSMVRKAAA